MKMPSLADFRRIVVKVGSSLLVDSEAGALNEAWLRTLVDDIAHLHGEKRDLLVVSSGAIALGRSRLKLPAGPLRLEDSQAAAAVGQIAHPASYIKSFSYIADRPPEADALHVSLVENLERNHSRCR